MKVCVIGVGYIGLPTGSILAENGFNVVGVDIDGDYLDSLRHKKFKSNEMGLIELINKNMDIGSLRFSISIEKADVFILCTPTPLKADKTVDLSYLLDGLESIVPFLEKDNLVIIESTVPPGTTNNIIKPLIESQGHIVGDDIFLAYCPERVIPNDILVELLYNTRLIGGSTKKCQERAMSFYKHFAKGEIITEFADLVELVKIIENSYRDTNIAFANELALLCNKLDLDVYKAIELANKHPRVKILNPGIGVGGHCLPVDSYFISNNHSDFTKIIKLSRQINDNMSNAVSEKIINLLDNIENPIVAIWGLAYKGNSNDIRNSPAKKIFNTLKEMYLEIRVFEPLVYDDDINVGINSLVDASILIVLVDHKEFIEFDYNKYIPLMKNKLIFDGANVVDRKTIDNDIKIIKLFKEV